MTREVSIQLESWPSIIPFRISNNVWDDFPCVVCEIRQDGMTGRGEGLGVYYHDETPESMAAQLQQISAALSAGADLADDFLQNCLHSQCTITVLTHSLPGSLCA